MVAGTKSRAEHLLSCALTYRESQPRKDSIPLKFNTASEAVSQFMDVLMHEAREGMQEALTDPPDQPFMHPVDMDTNEPGIVDQKEELHILRCATTMPRVVYRPRSSDRTDTQAPKAPPIHDKPCAIIEVTADKAEQRAQKELERTIKRAEKRASEVEERTFRAAEKKRQRENETPDEKARRLAEARERREMTKREKEAAEALGSPAVTVATASPVPPRSKKAAPPPLSEDALVCPDKAAPLATKARRRVPGEKARFFPHPLPHHRHLEALQTTSPNELLLPALLDGVAVEELSIIQGPPGTGKTRELIRLIADQISSTKRVFVCAPTNVGVCNLYHRCLAEGLGDECSLTLAPERIPTGTTVMSNDPNRRIVCGTISGRSGATLNGQDFDVVVIDEAAQCMEAWVWGLFRPEVTCVIMAGDVNQLPACASNSGIGMKHERSLLERLMLLGYENTTELVVQNRMAPELLAFPNRAFYKNQLKTGAIAPQSGGMTIHTLTDAAEQVDGSSYINRTEALEAARFAALMVDELGSKNVVIITPYAAQCRLLLAQKTGLEVHTIDSFQGREADGVVLCCVRDGSNGVGFWADGRRVTVALTRAKRRLAVVVSQPDKWPASCQISAMLAGHS